MKSSWVLMGMLSFPLVAPLAHGASIKKDIAAQTVVQKAMAPEAITISDQGTRLTFIARSMQELKSAPPTSAWMAEKVNGVWTEARELPWRGMVTSVAFANHDQWLVATISRGTAKGYLEILKNAMGDREQIGNLIGFDHRIEIFDAKDPKTVLMSFRPDDLGLEKPEMLKHARISPDGQWLAFYTHGYESQRGIHLHNLKTNQNIYLGAYDDKHPTWTPDGSKVLFHNQTGGDSFSQPGGPESSLVGYYELSTSNGTLSAQRVLMDSNVQGFIYQKHPSVYPGTDLLFFHGVEEEGKSKKLFVRRLKPNSKIYKLSDLMSDQVELKGAKHANSSFGGNGLYFVAHKKDAATTEFREGSNSSDYTNPVLVQDLKDIYWISNEDVQEINRQVKD